MTLHMKGRKKRRKESEDQKREGTVKPPSKKSQLRVEGELSEHKKIRVANMMKEKEKLMRTLEGLVEQRIFNGTKNL